MIALRAGRLIDGTGSAVRRDALVLIEGDRILDVTGAGAAPAGAQLIDAADATVLPGLIDAHLHLLWSGVAATPGAKDSLVTELPAARALACYANARRDLEAGFTAVRDVHCLDWADIALRNAIAAELAVGPRISAGGYGLTSTGGHMDDRAGLRPDVSWSGFSNVVDTVDEARRAVRYLVMMGADHIKINAGRGVRVRGRLVAFAPEMRLDVMEAICEEAHTLGRRVAAHSLGSAGELWAVRAGVDSLEHAHFISEETLHAMAEHGTFLVPTMTHCVRNAAILRETVPKERWGDNLILRAYESMYKVIPRAIQLGIRVATGTDAGADNVPHGCNAQELELLTTVGMSPGQAIAAATSTAAAVLDWTDSLGTLERGKMADLLVVDGDPTQDIRILQQRERIQLVMKGGRIVAGRGDRPARG
jgi:imidazolonepropionase-like amidohydrolase